MNQNTKRRLRRGIILRNLHDARNRFNELTCFKKKTLWEYSLMSSNGPNSACHRYLVEFKREHPEIADKYFNMRWCDFACNS